MLPRRKCDRDVWRHTRRGNVRQTLCAMRSAPRNGAVALGSVSHRPLEALQKVQQALTARCVESMRSLMAWRSLRWLARPCPLAFPVLFTPKVGTMMVVIRADIIDRKGGNVGRGRRMSVASRGCQVGGEQSTIAVMRYSHTANSKRP